MYCSGLQEKKLQYYIKHILSITINKPKFVTLPLGLDVEITQEYAPWEKGQIFVLLGQKNAVKNVIIVREIYFTTNGMWELIAMVNQNNHYTERFINSIYVNINGNVTG